ncbi:hypothetical protein K435DRAFT_859790 [Dendrothele bispora CBS 962.96]|uniref:Uncharacterized protein n=1 Tax=Dendrothele bispora (strain CBS 962.96) TaxID=1314807 RepID=A0A4S8LZX0_DENBC|nr:hypothetical protein K435DRAFT_859790 [Dendrothele bispora CBS 962.96]
MFVADSKLSYPDPVNSLLLDHQNNNSLYSTDILPHPSSAAPVISMSHPTHHQHHKHQPSQSTFCQPSPNPLSSSYATRPPPVPAPPHGRPSQTKKTQVKLFPVQAMVMAAHCACLPPFVSSPNVDSVVSPSPVPHEATVPVCPICLPHPQSISALLQFLPSRSPLQNHPPHDALRRISRTL